MTIREMLQENLDDYILKTDDELVDMIINFGCGELEFHTVDIERLIREKRQLEEKIEGLIEIPKNRTFKVVKRNPNNNQQIKKRTYSSIEDFERYSPDIIKRYSWRWIAESYELINGTWKLIETVQPQNSLD
jgi:hypothetical protein